MVLAVSITTSLPGDVLSNTTEIHAGGRAESQTAGGVWTAGCDERYTGFRAGRKPGLRATLLAAPEPHCSLGSTLHQVLVLFPLQKMPRMADSRLTQPCDVVSFGLACNNRQKHL
jgi:hypothetical protein